MTSFDPETLRLTLQLATTVASIGGGIYAAFLAIRRKLQSQIDEMRNLSEQMHGRIQLLERDNYYSPSQTDMTAIRNSIGHVHQELSRLDGRMEGVGRAVDVMHQHLMNTGNTD